MPRRHRSTNCQYFLFNPQTTLDQGWSIARRIGLARGESMVDMGTVTRVTDDVGNLIGYRLKPANEPRRPVPSLQTAICITARELQAAVGLMGRSRTAGMNEDQRLSRVHPNSGKILPAEDFVERSMEKLRLYPEIGDNRASRIAPRVRKTA